jgi:hypothetical protein
MPDGDMNYYWIRILLDAGDFARVRKALDENRQLVHESDRREGSLVTYAIDTRNLVGLSLLLSRGASPDGAKQEYDPPLCRAMMLDGSSAITFAALLMAAGADLHREGLRGTPLHAAVCSGRPDLVEFLLAMGGDVNWRTSAEGITPLWFAVLARNTEMVRLLLRHGADTTIADLTLGKTPYELAVEKDDDARDTLMKVLAGVKKGDAKADKESAGEAGGE